MRSGWVEGGGVTAEKGGSRKRGRSGPPDPPPPLDTPMKFKCKYHFQGFVLIDYHYSDIRLLITPRLAQLLTLGFYGTNILTS